MVAGQGLVDRLFTTATITQVAWANPRMRSIRLEGPAIKALQWVPGQQLRVAVQDILTRDTVRSAFRDALRTYSVWAREGDCLELRVLDHGDGPGARWAREAKSGDSVRFRGPEGDFVLHSDADYHLFVGEETACVAFGPMTRAAQGKAVVVAEVDSPEAQLSLEGEVHWSHRNSRTAASSQTLADQVAALELPSGRGRAYLGGEARTIQLVRDHLVKVRGWSRRDIVTKPFWTPGKRGLD